MAGYTNYAVRQIVREFGGAGLLATEMVNAKGFVWMAEHEAEHPDRLWGVADEPRPLAVQMWDNDPATLAKWCTAGARVQSQRRRHQLWLPGARRGSEGAQRFLFACASRTDGHDYRAGREGLRPRRR